MQTDSAAPNPPPPPPRRSISASASALASGCASGEPRARLIRPQVARLIALSVKLISLLALAIAVLPPPVDAFCPFKCTCNDVQLTANCTQVGAITAVPMTLNPLLKRLTLNQLPMSELSNSLALYRQLEQLNLNANQLRQVKYENFNFNSAPKMVQLHLQLSGSTSGQRLRTSPANEHDELHAKHLKHSLEKQLNLPSDEIRFHLRELQLANNKIEQLGEHQLSSHSSYVNSELDSAPQGDNQQQKSLKGHELERLAPFLSLSKLELLDLGGNRLRRLHQHAFLGLLRLKRLDLSRNQLELIDRHALVGLLALEELDLSSNRLVRHQQQLAQLSQLICMGPLMELRKLDLSSNAPTFELSLQSTDSQRLVLPNQMFICAAKLTKLNLRALKLRYIQVEAFDQLDQLQSLDLSENLFEQVPINTLRAARAGLELEAAAAEMQTSDTANQLTSLRELKLSKNPIEFVNANSFENLKQLRRLEMSQMPQLVSFDLASLITLSPVSTNANLEELRLNQNQRLQALRSSSRLPIKLPKLKLLDLSGSSELREVHLDQMVKLGAFGQPPLEVDISNSNNLNCSSCQLNWLIEASKQRVPLATPAQLHPSAAPATAATGSASGWAPIPFDPYNSLAGANEFAASARPQQKVTLLNSDLINCAWPFSMSLMELINLETNYAPLFGHDCQQRASFGADANRKLGQHNSTLPERAAAAPAPNQMQFLYQQQQVGGRNLMSSASGKQLEEQTNVASGNANGAQQSANSSAGRAYALIGLLLISVTLAALLLRLRALVSQRRKLHLNCSPSFTATTSIESPSSSAGGSSASGRHRVQLAANPLLHEQVPSQASSYYYFAPGLQQQRQPAAPKASAVFQNAAQLLQAANCDAGHHIGARLSSALTTSSANGNRAPHHGRPNLFSRFAARLSGGQAAGARAQQQQQQQCQQEPNFVGIGTTLRFHGGRCAMDSPGQQASFSTTRPSRRVIGGQAAPVGAQLIYADRPAQVDAAAFVAPSVANHYSICGDVNEHQQQQLDVACQPAGQCASFVEPAQEAAISAANSNASVSPRKNKRRRRRLDDNHTNGHLNQLHAPNDYKKLGGQQQPAAALEQANCPLAPRDEAEFIYANS